MHMENSWFLTLKLLYFRNASPEYQIKIVSALFVVVCLAFVCCRFFFILSCCFFFFLCWTYDTYILSKNTNFIFQIIKIIQFACFHTAAAFTMSYNSQMKIDKTLYICVMLSSVFTQVSNLHISSPVWLTNLMQMLHSNPSASSAAHCILSIWFTITCIILGLITRIVCTYPQAVWKRRVCWVFLWVLE